MTEIDRPLTDEERQLLVKTLAAHLIADQAGCSTEEANDVLARFAAMGQLEITGDAEDVYVRANGNLLVEAKRDWLAFHAAHPGNDPMRDERRERRERRDDDD